MPNVPHLHSMRPEADTYQHIFRRYFPAERAPRRELPPRALRCIRAREREPVPEREPVRAQEVLSGPLWSFQQWRRELLKLLKW